MKEGKKGKQGVRERPLIHMPSSLGGFPLLLPLLLLCLGGGGDQARAQTVPGAPAAPLLNFATAFTLNIRYFEPANDGGAALDRWVELQFSTDPAFNGAGSTQTSPGSGNFTKVQLTPATPYYVRSRSKNGVGRGAWSAGAGPFNTLPNTANNSVPGPPVAPTLITATSTTLEVQCSLPVNTGGLKLDIWYHVEVALDASFTSVFTSQQSAPPTGVVTIQQLNVNTSYWVRSRNQNAAGVGLWSPAGGPMWTSTSSGTNVPGAPATPILVSATSFSLTFQYFAPVDTGGLPLDSWFSAQVHTSTNFPAGGGGASQSTPAAGTFTRTQLAADTAYYVRTRNKNAVGNGPWSAVAGPWCTRPNNGTATCVGSSTTGTTTGTPAGTTASTANSEPSGSWSLRGMWASELTLGTLALLSVVLPLA
jgi:hypothetical protein